MRGSSAVAHLPRRSIRRAVLLTVLIGATGGLATFLWSSRELDCEEAVDTKALTDIVIATCRREYQRTNDPRTGVLLADALYVSTAPDDLREARGLAEALRGTAVQADALQILGKVAHGEGRTEDAIEALQGARQLHRRQGNHRELARDNQALAKIQRKQRYYAEALQTLEECIAEARAASSERVEGLCHLTAASVLTHVGYFAAAYQEIDRATHQLHDDLDLAQLWYMRGNLEQEVVRDPEHPSSNESAVAAFNTSLLHARRARATGLLVNLYSNLAYSLAELGKTEDAERHLAEAVLLDQAREYATQHTQLTARIAYHRNNLSLAYSLNQDVYPNIQGHDDQIDVCVMQARIAMARNDIADAIMWAQRGVDTAERVRDKQTLRELRPWVLASRREPFELLFTAYARTGRVEDAVRVFDQWQGRTLLDGMAQPSRDPLLGLSTTATKIQNLGRWLPVVSKAPLMRTERRAVVEPLAKIDLVALAIADRHLWRLTSSRGQLALDDLGPIANLRSRLTDFMESPTTSAMADALGALLLTDDLARTTSAPLHVVLDAPLATLPVVALRWNQQHLIAARPVLRTPRLPLGDACAPARDVSSAVVLADAAGDLPNARPESSAIALRFQTTPLVGAAATSAALFTARSDQLLHVAVHAEVDISGGVLKLHDRGVPAAEISANKLGPSLVVLSACSTARSWDPELAHALSTAFLAGGSRRVVATLRPVTDVGALTLTSQFYREGGATDPVGVLAKIQARLARSDDKEWPSFAVFGNESCVSSGS